MSSRKNIKLLLIGSLLCAVKKAISSHTIRQFCAVVSVVFHQKRLYKCTSFWRVCACSWCVRHRFGAVRRRVGQHLERHSNQPRRQNQQLGALHPAVPDWLVGRPRCWSRPRQSWHGNVQQSVSIISKFICTHLNAFIECSLWDIIQSIHIYLWLKKCVNHWAVGEPERGLVSTECTLRPHPFRCHVMNDRIALKHSLQPTWMRTSWYRGCASVSSVQG